MTGHDPDDLVTVRRGDLEAALVYMGPGVSEWRDRLAAATVARATVPVVRCVDGCGTVLAGRGGAHRRAEIAGWSRLYGRDGTRFRCPACRARR